MPDELLEDHQRERVLEAASGVFATRGYHATTVDDLVAAAKIGVGNFYKLFDGKEGCFLEAYDRILARGRGRVVEAIASQEDWAAQVRAGLLAALKQVLQDPQGVRLVLAEAPAAGPAAVERHRLLVEELAAAFAPGREHCAHASELPKHLEDAMAAGLLWFLRVKSVEGKLAATAKSVEEAASIVLNPYLGTGAS
ncbi:MAG TPA: TetR/AcrR family transcriptional regulator [Solirubrobacterales bacterium]